MLAKNRCTVQKYHDRASGKLDKDAQAEASVSELDWMKADERRSGTEASLLHRTTELLILLEAKGSLLLIVRRGCCCGWTAVDIRPGVVPTEVSHELRRRSSCSASARQFSPGSQSNSANG